MTFLVFGRRPMRFPGMDDNKALLIIALLVVSIGGLYRVTAPRLSDEIKTPHGTVRFDSAGKPYVYMEVEQ